VTPSIIPIQVIEQALVTSLRVVLDSAARTALQE